MNERSRQIAIASFLIAIPALVTESIAFLDLPLRMYSLLRYMRLLGNYVRFNLFEVQYLNYYNHDTFYSAGFIEIAFYAVMIIGASTYVISKGKEIRIVRFCFAIIGLASVIGLIEVLFIFVFQFDYYLSGQGNIVIIVLFLARDTGVLLLSRYILMSMNETTTLEVYQDKSNEDTLRSTPKGYRFFHHLLDTWMAILVFGGMFSMINQYINFMDLRFGESAMVVAFVALFRFCYYMFYESVLKTTPAKLLTGSRVVAFDGTPPGISKIFGRTLCRFIPFEPFSFFGTSGWHDKLSETDVVKEIRTGVSGAWYFLIIPAFLILGIAGYFGFEKYEDYKLYVKGKRDFDVSVDILKHQVTHPTTAHYFKMKRNDLSTDEVIYLRVDAVAGNRIEVAVMVMMPTDKVMEIPPRFLEEDSTLLKTTIAIKDLEKLIVTDYDQILKYGDMLMEQGTINDSSFLSERAQYRIDGYFIDGAPIISGTENGSYNYEDNSMMLGFENCGWGGRIVSIKMSTGDIAWTAALPLDFDANSVDHYNCTPFTLTGNQSGRSAYTFTFVTEDARGRRQTYLVEGNGLRKTVHQVVGTSLE